MVFNVGILCEQSLSYFCLFMIFVVVVAIK